MIDSHTATRPIHQPEDFPRQLLGLMVSISSANHEMIDAEINNLLKVLGEELTADRSYVMRLSPCGQSLSNTHEWCAIGIDPFIDTLQNQRTDDFAWSMSRIARGDVLLVENTLELPHEAGAERAILLMQSIRSVILVPVMHAGEMLGFLGLDAVTNHVTWSPEISNLLKQIGIMLGGVFTRIDKERQLVEAHNSFRSLAENLDSVVYIYTPEFKPLFISSRWTELYGQTPEQIYDDPSLALAPIHPDDVDYVRRIWTSTWPNPLDLTFRMKSVSDDWLWVRCRSRPVHDGTGTVTLMVGAIEDVTSLLTVTDELSRRSEALEHAVKTRTHEYELAMEHLRREVGERKAAESAADRLRDQVGALSRLNAVGQYAAAIAHELNQPLLSIQNFAYALSRTVADKQQSDWITELNTQAERAANVVTLATRILKNKIPDRYAVDVTEIAHNALVLMKVQLADNGVTAKVVANDRPATVLAGEADLETVLINLIKNAISAFSRRINTVTPMIEIAVTTNDAEAFVDIRVTDNGPGIPPALVGQLFVPFIRESIEPGSLGLGLPISRYIVDRAGGKILLEKTSKGGSVFLVRWPKAGQKADDQFRGTR